MADESDIRRKYERAGQSHVFDYVELLSPSERSKLLSQLNEIDVEKLATLLQAASAESSNNDGIQPFSGPFGRSNDSQMVDRSVKTGMEAIRRGKVAALVLAGGQGTRLGFEGPKGMFDIGLPSGRTLFQLMAYRIKKLSELASAQGDITIVIPFYIMTSPLNHEQTVNYLASNDCLGLGVENVTLFPQGALPCMTEDGKIIMESAGAVAMAPDGNGGIYPSLMMSGALDDMTRRGVQYLHVFSIDNALVKPADPVFVGYCIDQEADCGNKVVWKVHAHEQVGVVASKFGKPCIVEYSEITSEMAELKDETGRLVFGAANICNHFYTVDFIRNRVLPNMGNLYHLARKKITYYDAERNESITPTANNGVKLESFIFDVFPLSEKMAVLEIERSEEFSPVKNKDGSDSPDTARTMVSELCKKWVIKAGGNLVGDVANGICEVSPFTSIDGEGLDELVQGKDITCPFRL
jgi:UDP-N-acetylglucosamine/UDP-N-acetylgalactosamine diphosphorylase